MDLFGTSLGGREFSVAHRFCTSRRIQNQWILPLEQRNRVFSRHKNYSYSTIIMTAEPETTATLDTTNVENTEDANNLMTPPASPRADYYGSLTSPISPAESLLSSPGADQPTTTETDTKAATKPRKNKPFLLRLLGKKKRKEKAAALEALAPPGLNQDATKEQAPETEPEIDWLENKKKQKSGGLFKSFRKDKVRSSFIR